MAYNTYDFINNFSLASQEKYPASWRFLGSNIGGTSMANPLIIPALISAGGNLLSGLLSGAGKGKAAKELKRATQPKTPYYETYAVLPYLQRLFQTSLLGALKQYLPESEDWGINFENLLSLLNQTPSKGTPYNPILRKYTSFLK